MINANKTTNKAKAVISLCFVLCVNYLAAQNAGSYTCAILKDDVRHLRLCDVLEVNNQYYLLANEWTLIKIAPSQFLTEHVPTITILDASLNVTQKKELFKKEDSVLLNKIFYDNKYFYVFGSISYNQKSKPFLAKYNEKFRLVQPISIYATNDTLSYEIRDVLITRKNEFICLCYENKQFYDNRLLQVNKSGKMLQDVCFQNMGWRGASIAETDSFYFVDFRNDHELLRFRKNSLQKYDTLTVETDEADKPELLISVGNQLIRSNVSRDYQLCEGDIFAHLETDRSIVFLNENMRIENRIAIGKPCADDDGRYNINWLHNMHYINPDSIYYAYITEDADTSNPQSLISIANFSWDGKLNFDYHLKIAEAPDLMKTIYRCKAISNGGVLVCGESGNEHGFLLMFHPTIENLTVKEPVVIERKIYPNPAQTQFTVTNTENTDIQLFNILGQKVFHVYGTTENTVINTVSLPQGLYVLKVVGSNHSTVHKVQVVK